MDVVYGVAAAVSLGLADFFAGGASRRLGPWPTMAATRAVGLLAMAVVVAFVPRPPAPSLAVAAAMLGVALASFGGVALLLRAFAIGALALVAPIAASFAVVTAVVALAAGERPPGLALGGVALLVLGVAVVSRPGGPHAASLAGVPEAAGAAICLGAAAWGFGEVTPHLGPYWPVLATRVLQLGLALPLALRGAVPPPRTLRQLAPVVVAAGLLEAASLVFFNLGVERTYTTTTTALSCLFGVVTAFLAWLFLRERLAPHQWAGVAIVTIGILLVSL